MLTINQEPLLRDMLADPIMRKLMESDGVSPAVVLRLLASLYDRVEQSRTAENPHSSCAVA